MFVKVVEIKVVLKGISLWLEVRKSANTKEWSRIEESCFGPFSSSVFINAPNSDEADGKLVKICQSRLVSLSVL